LENEYALNDSSGRRELLDQPIGYKIDRKHLVFTENLKLAAYN
jgi:hypothetical protein